MAKKITLKDKEGTVLCPHTAIEQVQGLKEALESGGNIEIDTRNLIPNSTKIGRVASSSDNYSYVTITLPTDVGAKIGDVFTFNCDKVENVQGNPTEYSIRLYNKTTRTAVSKEQQITAENRVRPLEAWIDVEQGELALLVYMGAAGATAGNEVYFHNCTLVKGDKPMLLWQAAPEDIQEQIDGKLGKTEKAADSLLADVARNVSNGAITQSKIGDGSVTTSKIANTAVTSTKIENDVILNGTPSMTVEPTTSSPDRTIASVGLVKKVMEDIEVGGTNLILNSDFSEGTEHWTNIYWGTTISSEENILKVDIRQTANQFGVSSSSVSMEEGRQYIVSFDVRSESISSLDYSFLRSPSGNMKLPNVIGITPEWQRFEIKFQPLISEIYNFGFGSQNLSTEISQSIEFRKVKLERGNKATDWSPAPEDVNTEISNAETRSKAYAEDYTDAEITKIENGQTVAQKANSLYDDDSGLYKNWGEIDSAITEKIGDRFEDYATKSYVQDQISNQVAVPIASETEYGKVELATPEDVTAVEADGSAVNNSAKAVTPYTLKEYIASKNFATSSDISSAVTSAKPVIFFQAAQPAGGKDGDIWIKP